jgi:hypothetical protein
MFHISSPFILEPQLHILYPATSMPQHPKVGIEINLTTFSQKNKWF